MSIWNVFNFCVHTSLTPEGALHRLQRGLMPRVEFDDGSSEEIIEGVVQGNDFHITCYSQDRRGRVRPNSGLSLIAFGIRLSPRISGAPVFQGRVREVDGKAIVEGTFDATPAVLSALLVSTLLGVSTAASDNLREGLGVICALVALFAGSQIVSELPYRQAITDFLEGLFANVKVPH